MSSKREGVVERYLLGRCRAEGFLCLKFVSPSRGGVPDRVVVTPAKTVFVEVKKPGGDLEKRQRTVHDKMRRHGAEVHVVDTKPIVDSFIRQMVADLSTDQKAVS
jgi:hypothetical protein